MLALALAAAFALAWAFRGPIGAHLTISYLRERGVPAGVQLERLDTKGFIGRFTLGPPGDPDLDVERLQVEFEPGVWWKRGLAVPRIRSIRMLRPKLKLAFDGRRLRYGSLPRLVDELLARTASG